MPLYKPLSDFRRALRLRKSLATGRYRELIAKDYHTDRSLALIQRLETILCLDIATLDAVV